MGRCAGERVLSLGIVTESELRAATGHALPGRKPGPSVKAKPTPSPAVPGRALHVLGGHRAAVTAPGPMAAAAPVVGESGRTSHSCQQARGPRLARGWQGAPLTRWGVGHVLTDAPSPEAQTAFLQDHLRTLGPHRTSARGASPQATPRSPAEEARGVWPAAGGGPALLSPALTPQLHTLQAVITAPASSRLPPPSSR